LLTNYNALSANVIDTEFVLVKKSEVGKPESSRWNVYICDAFKFTLVPLQPIIGPFLYNTQGLIVDTGRQN